MANQTKELNSVDRLITGEDDNASYDAKGKAITGVETNINDPKGAANVVSIKQSSIRFFTRFDESIDPSYLFNSSADTVTSRADLYSAIEELRLFGLDKSLPHKLSHIWFDRQGTGLCRVIIQKFEDNAWSYVIDFSTYNPIVKDKVWYVDYTNADGKRVVLVLDLNKSAMIIDGTIESSTSSSSYIISDNCFDTENTNILNLAAEQTLAKLKSVDLEGLSISTKTLSTKNQVLFPCFERYSSDLSMLGNQFSDCDAKRRDFYQAFKDVKLYGFDKTKPHKIEYLWRGAADDSSFFRFILSAYIDGAWTRVMDSTTKTYSQLGVVEDRYLVWDYTYVGKRFKITLDLSELNIIGSKAPFESGEPTLIFSQSCFIDNDLNSDSDVTFKSLTLPEGKVAPLSTSVISGLKPYVNSRRKPTFSFIFDDLRTSDALVYSIFKEFGFLPSYALISNRVDSTSIVEYQGYYNNGCTILSHSITHPVMNEPGNDTLIESEMAESKKTIESYGIRVSGWVTPSSALDPSYITLMEKYYGYGFTSLNAGLFTANIDPIKMGRYGLESSIDSDTHSWSVVEDFIDSAILNNRLVVFYSHQIPSTYLDDHGESKINEDDLRSLLTYLRAKVDAGLCQVLSCDEAVAQYYKTPII